MTYTITTQIKPSVVYAKKEYVVRALKSSNKEIESFRPPLQGEEYLSCYEYDARYEIRIAGGGLMVPRYILRSGDWWE